MARRPGGAWTAWKIPGEGGRRSNEAHRDSGERPAGARHDATRLAGECSTYPGGVKAGEWKRPVWLSGSEPAGEAVGTDGPAERCQPRRGWWAAAKSSDRESGAAGRESYQRATVKVAARRAGLKRGRRPGGWWMVLRRPQQQNAGLRAGRQSGLLRIASGWTVSGCVLVAPVGRECWN